jgi:hypothetical protein
MESITNIVQEQGISEMIIGMKNEMDFAELISYSEQVEKNITDLEYLNTYSDIFDDETYQTEYEKNNEKVIKSIDLMMEKLYNYLDNNDIELDNINEEMKEQLLDILDFCYEKDYIMYIYTEYYDISQFTKNREESDNYDDYDTITYDF